MSQNIEIQKYIVTWVAWRETWSGREQCDGKMSETVTAESPGRAIAKIRDKYLKGGFSHSIWFENLTAELAK